MTTSSQRGNLVPLTGPRGNANSFSSSAKEALTERLVLVAQAVLICGGGWLLAQGLWWCGQSSSTPPSVISLQTPPAGSAREIANEEPAVAPSLIEVDQPQENPQPALEINTMVGQ